MSNLRNHIIALILLLSVLPVMAQNNGKGKLNPEDRTVDMDSPTFVPLVKVSKVKVGSDSIQYLEMNNVYVYPQATFKNTKQQQAYNRLVYNVKKVLPIAKEVNRVMMETAEYLETLPNKRAKDEHMKRVEKAVKKEYTPRMKKLTYACQGRFLSGVCLDFRSLADEGIRRRRHRPSDRACGPHGRGRPVVNRLPSGLNSCPVDKGFTADFQSGIY